MKVDTIPIPLLSGVTNSHSLDDFLSVLKESSADVIIGPEYLVAGSSPLFAVNDLVEKIAPYSVNKLVIPGTVMRADGTFLYNTLYALSDGEVVFSYNKETTDAENVYSSLYNLPYETGGNDSSVFTWNNKLVGVEICRDHGHRRLKRSLAKQNLSGVDLHIVVANHLNGLNIDAMAGTDVVLVDGYIINPGSLHVKKSVVTNGVVRHVDGVRVIRYEL